MSENTGRCISERRKKIDPTVGDIVSIRGGAGGELGIVVSSSVKSYHYLDPERLPAEGDIIMIVMWSDGSCSEQLPFLLRKELAYE